MQEEEVKLEVEPEHVMEHEEEEEEEEEEGNEECRKFSPKHSQKLQFSIAQIMGFDSSVSEMALGASGELAVMEREREELGEDMREVKVEEGEGSPTKLWRPLPCAPSTAPVSSLPFPADPAAMALLR